MSVQTPPKSRATGAPKCRTCGVAHWGTCANHDARGAVADQFRGHSSEVEREVSTLGVAGSTPAGRSKSTALRKAVDKIESQTKATAGTRRGLRGTAETPRPGRESRVGPAAGAGAAAEIQSAGERRDAVAADPEATHATPATKRAPKKPGRPATGFDKKAYQRELMRKRRAAKKGQD